MGGLVDRDQCGTTEVFRLSSEISDIGAMEKFDVVRTRRDVELELSTCFSGVASYRCYYRWIELRTLTAQIDRFVTGSEDPIP